jgi:hypothetical protein
MIFFIFCCCPQSASTETVFSIQRATFFPDQISNSVIGKTLRRKLIVFVKTNSSGEFSLILFYNSEKEGKTKIMVSDFAKKEKKIK